MDTRKKDCCLIMSKSCFNEENSHNVKKVNTKDEGVMFNEECKNYIHS